MSTTARSKTDRPAPAGTMFPKHASGSAPAVREEEQDNDLMFVEEDEPDSLLSDQVLDKAASAFGALGRDVVVSENRASGGQSLEAMVRDMMRPMLKDWLEENLPEIVEEVVEREVHRVASRKRRH